MLAFDVRRFGGDWDEMRPLGLTLAFAPRSGIRHDLSDPCGRRATLWNVVLISGTEDGSGLGGSQEVQWMAV